MPFVKKNDTQGSQPPTAARNIFIGRTGELLFFIQNILKPEDPTHNIISISGQGGVGKSTLLARFVEQACEAPFKDYCLTALVDEHQATSVGMMEKFAQQLQIVGTFEKRLKQYKEALRRQHTEQPTLHDTLIGSIPELAGAVVEGIPVAGPLLREGTKITVTHLLKDHRISLMQQDAELLETAIDDLTKAFTTELNDLAETTITLGSTRKKRQRRIVLFFDTFEQLTTEATPWLLDHFLAVPQISNNVVLVVAGRDPIEHSSPDDPKRWLPYCDDGTVYWISLNSFTEDETRTYLMSRGITDADQIASLWQLSRGLPLYLGLLTSSPQGNIDPTKDVIANFLRWIPEREHIKRQLALDAALLSRPFNQDDLEVFSYVPESDRVPLYQWLIEQPFVRSTSQEGRHLYHDVARDLFSRHLYQRSQKRYTQIRGDLAAYYQQSLEKIRAEKGKEVFHLEEWLELILATTSQLLLLPDRASHIKAIEHTLNAYDEHMDTEQGKATAGVLRTLSQNPSPHYISPHSRWVTTHLFHYIEAAGDSQERLAALNSLLEQVTHEPSYSGRLLMGLYERRAGIYFLLDEEQQVAEDLQHILDLTTDATSSAHQIHRGWAYHRRQEYQKALAAFNHVLELNPNDAEAYKGRGWTYLPLGEARSAINDLHRALTLNPHLSYIYNGIGKAHLFLKEYQKALEAFQRSIQYDRHGDYFGLGLTYLWLKDSRQAQACFTRACEEKLDEVNACWMAEWARMCYEGASLESAERLEAIAAAARQKYTIHICRGMAFLLRGYFTETLAELELAILLNRGYSSGWSTYFWKGMAWASLGQNEEAVAAIERAVAMGLPPILLAPLCWFEQKRPDFYEEHLVLLLTNYT
jgi:tetratricopeptide (TPR) repeat protein